MSNVVVYLATISEVFLDLCSVSLPVLFTIFSIFVFFVVLNTIAECIELCCVDLFRIIMSLLCFSFLKRNFGAKLLKKLMGLLENLHKSRIPLCIDQVDVSVKVVVFERVESLNLLSIFLLLFVFLLLVQVVLGEIGCSLDFTNSLLVELKELFLAVEYFF